MRTIILLAFGLFFIGSVQAQVGSSISTDGTPPNTNAMLDVQSPSTGDGKGMLIPRVTVNQRTNASASLAGGLLDGSGNLRGGAAQGLIVYQTDGSQGLYFNSSLTAAPTWVYLGNGTNLNMNGFGITNVSQIDFNGNAVSIGSGANGYWGGVAAGNEANGYSGAAVGYSANAAVEGVAAGKYANGYFDGVAMGREANGCLNGVAIGYQSEGTNSGAAVGWNANGSDSGAAMGYLANGSMSGAAVGHAANGYNGGAVMGRDANGSSSGAAVGDQANGFHAGAAVGYGANGSTHGVAVGFDAQGANTNMAIGESAYAVGGVERIAIGHDVDNNVNNSIRVRGTLYLDGGTGVVYRATFGSGAWANKAFTIDHPLDPENKVLRHFCLEGPQVWNVYAGNAQLVNGQAVVQLPDYYSSLNLVGSEIYSLTVVGTFAQIAVGTEVNNNRFIIIGDKDVKVSWTIKVLRNDPGCLEDLQRRPVEQLKSELAKP